MGLESWASAEIFAGGAKSTFCLSFSVCWQCNANGRTQKENVQCCGNSCIQCFPCKKTLQVSKWFSEHGVFKTELAEFEMNNKLCDFLEQV